MTPPPFQLVLVLLRSAVLVLLRLAVLVSPRSAVFVFLRSAVLSGGSARLQSKGYLSSSAPLLQLCCQYCRTEAEGVTPSPPCASIARRLSSQLDLPGQIFSAVSLAAKKACFALPRCCLLHESQALAMPLMPRNLRDVLTGLQAVGHHLDYDDWHGFVHGKANPTIQHYCLCHAALVDLPFLLSSLTVCLDLRLRCKIPISITEKGLRTL